MSQNKNTGQTLRQNHTPQTGQEFGRVHQSQDRAHHDKDHLGMETRQKGEISSSEQHGHDQHNSGAPHVGNTVFIDQTAYHTTNAHMTGADLRNLPTPPIGADKKLFRVVAGQGEDIRLLDSDLIEVNILKHNQGRHFYSDHIKPQQNDVATRAYYIYQNQGCQPGHDLENWTKAETELKCEPHK